MNPPNPRGSRGMVVVSINLYDGKAWKHIVEPYSIDGEK